MLHFLSVCLSVCSLSLSPCLPTAELPPVKLEGDRNEVHITFFVSRSLFKQLPESIMVSQGIKIVPILFNRGNYCSLTNVCELKKAFQCYSGKGRGGGGNYYDRLTSKPDIAATAIPVLISLAPT